MAPIAVHHGQIPPGCQARWPVHRHIRPVAIGLMLRSRVRRVPDSARYPVR
jgi:hypothetical protein